jgi:hypothetical protein
MIHRFLTLGALMKNALSDDMFDGILVTLIILAITAGVSYWLYTMTVA